PGYCASRPSTVEMQAAQWAAGSDSTIRDCPCAESCAMRSAEGAATQAGQAESPPVMPSPMSRSAIVIRSALHPQIEALLEQGAVLRHRRQLQHPLAGRQIHRRLVDAADEGEGGRH